MTFRERLAWALVVVLLSLGLFELWSWHKGPQQPTWGNKLEVLKSAPLPFREEVEVAFPTHWSQTQRQWVLMELFWRFPQVRWALAGDNLSPHRWVLAAPGAPRQGRILWQADGWYLGWRVESP